MASASTNGAVAKNHVLGFLGMYNVLSLLVFTIAFTCLFTLQPIVSATATVAVTAQQQPLEVDSNRTTAAAVTAAATTRNVQAQIAEWLDAINFILFALSAIMSFGGLNATSIAYNTASACSDANATALIKMPSFAKYLKAANDASIFGSMPLFLATFVLTIKHGFVLVPYDGTPVAVFVPAATGLVFLFLGFKVRKHKFADPVVVTHAVMFAGLMGERAVCPDGEPDGVAWALRTPGELIEQYVFNKTLDAITAGAAVDEKGRRADKKVARTEIPQRVEATLDGYRRATLREHLARLGGGGDADEGLRSPHEKPGAQFQLQSPPSSPTPERQRGRKLPFGPRPRVVPVAAAATRSAGF